MAGYYQAILTDIALVPADAHLHPEPGRARELAGSVRAVDVPGWAVLRAVGRRGLALARCQRAAGGIRREDRTQCGRAILPASRCGRCAVESQTESVVTPQFIWMRWQVAGRSIASQSSWPVSSRRASMTARLIAK